MTTAEGRCAQAKAKLLCVAQELGLQLTNESSDEHLCFYFDAVRDGNDIACLSRGWDDPGVRMSEQIEIPASLGNPLWFERLIDFSATNGVAVTCSYENNIMTISLESVLYDEGLNSATLENALNALADCKIQLQRIRYSAASEILGKTPEPFEGSGQVH
jgi:hypothetical protein